MITVPEATEIIVKRSRYLSEALSKGIINTSSLARYIKPEIEKMLIKEVSTASLIMALQRFSQTQKQPHFRYSELFTSSPDMILYSNLCILYIKNTSENRKKITHLHNEIFAQTQGVNEACIVINMKIAQRIKSLFDKQTVLTFTENISAITIRLPKKAIEAPGVYYFFLKSLAWEEISVREIISVNDELILIFDDEYVQRAFATLTSLFTPYRHV